MEPVELQQTPSRTHSDSSRFSSGSVSLTDLSENSKSTVDVALVAGLPASHDNENENEASYFLQLDRQHAGPQSSERSSSENKHQTRASSRSVFTDWWEELVSVAIGLVCTFSAITILAYMDRRSMRDWRLPIQPNSLVALLATLTRAALVYPVSECIGHLKWVYFERPRPLNFMNAFDIASRGPLGTSKLLWTTRLGSPLASCASLVIIILLLFQPFMQQAIEVSSRLAPLSNETALAARTTTWWLQLNPWMENPDRRFWPALSHGLFKAVTNEDPSQPINTYCSTSVCKFPEFDTLAMCSVCEDQVIQVNAFKDFDNCTFSLNVTDKQVIKPTFSEISHEIESRRYRENFYGHLSCQNNLLSFVLNLNNGYENWSNDTSTYISLSLFGRKEGTYGVDYETYPWLGQNRPFGSDAPVRSFKSCRNSAPDKITQHTYEYWNTVLRSDCLNSTSDLQSYVSGNKLTSNFGTINGTLTTCSLQPCAKRYSASKLENTRISAELVSSTTKFQNATKQSDTYLEWSSEYAVDSAVIQYCADNTTDCQYSWRMYATRDLGAAIKKILDSEDFVRYQAALPSTFDHNFTTLYHRISDEISVLMRSSANPNATNMTGIAYGTDIYVKVRWLWLVLPLLTITASMLVLGFSILDSNKKNYLFKNKILASFAFELDGWEKEEYRADHAWERHTVRRLEETSERMMASIHLPSEDDDGLKLKKA
ncbi:hypothetical protein BU25DRAFT_414706 [Macroventuria anomochaeta]|uniref:Uncharacterized protein n=1 Tax=Macroventuria anomochaeta TaxID=301207 RepID=A0ACB6RM46_9PLEO|nr:uncharacterized protein BU25DRAFT_414706 [Macroventuria anomochaeta]KAF2622936.1 hypothetical protein BU25DRAFT_414706 [Macroventuria anomochaeta]